MLLGYADTGVEEVANFVRRATRPFAGLHVLLALDLPAEVQHAALDLVRASGVLEASADFEASPGLGTARGIGVSSDGVNGNGQGDDGGSSAQEGAGPEVSSGPRGPRGELLVVVLEGARSLLGAQLAPYRGGDEPRPEADLAAFAAALASPPFARAVRVLTSPSPGGGKSFEARRYKGCQPRIIRALTYLFHSLTL